MSKNKNKHQKNEKLKIKLTHNDINDEGSESQDNKKNLFKKTGYSIIYDSNNNSFLENKNNNYNIKTNKKENKKDINYYSSNIRDVINDLTKYTNKGSSIFDNINGNNRINEVLIESSELKKIGYLYTVCKSICKIEVKKGKFIHIGSGFLIKLMKGNELLCFLMTNEHVIEKEMVESNENITIKYDNKTKKIKINLDKEERFIRDYRYIGIDAIVVEILDKDKIDDDFFLVPNKEYIEEYEQYKNEEIYIPQFAGGGKLSKSKGIIKSINSYYEFTHLASTSEGSSGSPILLKDSIFVIRIHKAGNDLIYKKVYYDNGEYEGEFKNGEREGYGKYIWEDGEYYIGQWLKGKKHGKGIIYYKDGKIRYEGEFKNDKLEGYGKYIRENDEYYIGQWLNGKKHGEGIIYYKDGKILYDGEFKNNKREGYGKYIWEDGKYYIGQWINGKIHGEGIKY